MKTTQTNTAIPVTTEIFSEASTLLRQLQSLTNSRHSLNVMQMKNSNKTFTLRLTLLDVGKIKTCGVKMGVMMALGLGGLSHLVKDVTLPVLCYSSTASVYG